MKKALEKVINTMLNDFLKDVETARQNLLAKLSAALQEADGKAIPPAVIQTASAPAPAKSDKPKADKPKADKPAPAVKDYTVSLNKTPDIKEECTRKTVENVLNTMYRGDTGKIKSALETLDKTGTFKGTYKTFTHKQ